MNAKPLFILFFFAFLITIFAGGTIGDTDLTPDTPPAQGSASGSGALAPLVQGVQSGLCGSPYTIRSGDTLSGIARACALNLPDLLAVNPQISNPNLIHVGQQITIPFTAVQSAQPVVEALAPVQEEPAAPVQASPTPVEIQQENQPPVIQEEALAPTPDAILSAFETARVPKDSDQSAPVAATPNALSPALAVGPGSLVDVSINGLPPNALVTIGIGQVGSEPFLIDERITNEEGILRVAVPVPANAERNQEWTVTITTMDEPVIQVTAVPFKIER